MHVEPHLGEGMQVGKERGAVHQFEPSLQPKKVNTTDIFIHFYSFLFSVFVESPHYKFESSKGTPPQTQSTAYTLGTATEKTPPKITHLVFVNSTVTTELSFKVCFFPAFSAPRII
jgi:hypothetical protein